MKKLIYVSLLFLYSLSVAQSNDYYFPPSDQDNWETVDHDKLGWNLDKLDTLEKFLAENNSKGFVILYKGWIAQEFYFDDFNKDSVWYWASAAKTLTTFLVGKAQEDGFLDIGDKTSDYLGEGWTSCTKEQEDQIKIKNHISMTCGLDDSGNKDCTDKECLVFKAAAGTRWAYHNAVNTLLHDILYSATGKTNNQLTYQYLTNTIGLKGLWVKSEYLNIFGSTPRNMARFGHLILSNGTWDGEEVMSDKEFFNEMINTSQDINKSYGYMWWLNGKGSYMLPGLQFEFQTDLIPNAPDDLVSGLGKNDQKVYVVPSLDMVVVRMGNSADQTKLALSSFDNLLWGHLMELFDDFTSVEYQSDNSIVYPNPASDVISFSRGSEVKEIEILNSLGVSVVKQKNPGNQIHINHLSPGVYFVRFSDFSGNLRTQKFIKN
jgi:CubicO group peptidase (beta-lactamase class C family)